MAIIYSYPLADEVTNDSWVLGSEMDNGQRVVKNYSVGDIAAFIQEQFTTTPTLQEVASEGNTVSGGLSINVNNGQYHTSLEGVSVNVSSSSNLLSLYAASALFEKQFGSGSVELKFPNTIDEARVIEFPDASGTMALVEDIPTTAYRVYTAIINQSGNAAPTVISVLENTLGGTVTFEYTNPGLYYAVLTGEFTANKTTAMLWGGKGAQLFKAAPISFDKVLLVTYNTSGVPANDQMGITTLEIRVYN